MKLKAVFLDKDGALLPQVPANDKSEKVDLNESFVEGLQLLQSHGYLLVIVSSKEGEGDAKETDSFQQSIVNSCSRLGIYLDGIYYSAGERINDSSPEEVVTAPLLTAAGEMDIDLSLSWMVGDIVNDVKAGKRVGCNTVLVTNGNVAEKTGVAKYKARNLAEAAKKIVRAKDKSRQRSNGQRAYA
jgi:D-glycero-D-manno-heptose 1,7-bisphosphate phosphatase